MAAHALAARGLAKRYGSVEALGGVDLAVEDGELVVEGRGAHQGPEVDGLCRVEGHPGDLRVGELVTGTVVASEGADLVVRSSGAVR